MQNAQPSVFAREDTFFGVCEAIGEDFGFNANYLRVALPLLLFLYPVATLAGYAIAGVIVLASRLIFPKPRHATAVEDAAGRAAVRADAADLETLPLAA